MSSQKIVPRSPRENAIEVEPRFVGYAAPSGSSNNGVEWHRMYKVLRRHWRLTLAFAFGLELLLLLIVAMIHNSYEAHATLEITPTASEPVSLQQNTPAPSPVQQDYLDTQTEILRSDYLALKVINHLHLDQNKTFYEPNLLGRAVATMKSWWSPAPKERTRQEMIDHLLTAFRNGLSVNEVKNSLLVNVSFSTEDPQLSSAVVNDLVEQYLEDATKSKFEAAERAAKSMDPELKELKKSADQMNQEVANFQKTHEGTELATPLPMEDNGTADSLGGALSSNPIAGRVAQLNQQLTQSIADRLQQESYIKLLSQGRNDDLPQMKDSPLIQQLTQRLVDSRAQLAQALAVYGGNNPQVRKLQQQTAELDKQLNLERQRIVDQIKSSYNSARLREDLIRKSMNGLKGQLDASNANAVQFDMLRREAQAQANLYVQTASRVRQLAVSGALSASNIRVLSAAVPPVRPSSPKRLEILSVGLLLGLVGGMAVAFVAEGMDDTISTLDDVHQLSGLPALGLLPRSAARARRPAPRLAYSRPGLSAPKYRVPVLHFLTERPDSPEAEAVRSLETAIRISAQTKEHPVKTILVTSAFPKEGKTTVASNLAAALSRNFKTCLIDADIRHPVITSAYGLSERRGLQDALIRPNIIDELPRDPMAPPNLTVLGAGVSNPSAMDRLTSDAMVQLVEQLKGKFEYVVIDSPPVIPFAESKWLSAIADGIVVVARCSTTTRRALTWTMNILDDVQSKILGVVLNGVDPGSEEAYGGVYRRYYSRSA